MHHPHAPICPNCSQLILARTVLHKVNEQEANLFECSRCKVSFTTEDHLQISGPPLVQSIDSEVWH